MSNEVFALDIGTRTVAGLILASSDDGFELKEAVVEQQLPGAMADGQIHHIDAVANTIRRIKEKLEDSCGRPLQKAAVAAAGRSLRTQIGSATMPLARGHRMSSDEVRALELDAVRDAVQKLSPENSGGVMHSYLCVGYSVIQYHLDGERIGALQGHQGSSAGVEVIATFLPRIVIDSLSTALERAGLDMLSLTLEPIAAMHVVVPPTMRMLNIALVDVGAGTSDLAISAEGTVKGYGMLSYAGDAMTSALADHFLLDFKVAEQLKVELQPDQPTRCEDVFGNELSLSYDEVVAVLRPRVEILAEKIAQEITALNGTAPKGVILIGGGSRVPGLAELVAQKLHLPESLVRIRDRDSLKIVQGSPHFSGPEAITPIGIGAANLDHRAMELIQVTVNDQRLQLLNVASSTVAEALLHAGLIPSELVGRPGSAFTVELNGRCITLPGSKGQPAFLTKNGEPCELSATLAHGDRLVVEPGQPGEPPQVTLGELIDAQALVATIELNGSPLEVKPLVSVNGAAKPFSYILQDRDKITFQPVSTFQELFELMGMETEKEIPFVLNGESRTVTEQVQLWVDGVESPLSTPIHHGLEVEYVQRRCTIRELFRLDSELPEVPGITVRVNGKQVDLDHKEPVPLVNGQPVNLDYEIKPQDRIEYSPSLSGALGAYIVTDIFRVYEPDEAFTSRGGSILVNGVKSGFTAPIKHGDVVELVPYGAETANS
ncbi:MAG: cell division FtsA domain-containing protein [Limnochordia bacterium]|jgi:cell division protein FtsA